MEGQLSFFEKGSSSDDGMLSINYPEIDEYDFRLLLAMEKDMLGLYISGHPLSEYENDIKKWVTLYSIDLMTDEEKEDLTMGSHSKDGAFVRIAGIVTDIKTITTRSNQLMAFVTIEDLTGQMEIIVFPNTLEKYGDLLKPEFPVWIEGKLSVREDEAPKVITEMIKPIVKGEGFEASIKKADNSNEPRLREPTSRYEKTKPVYLNNASEQKAGNNAGYCLKVRIPDKTPEKITLAVISLLKYFEGTTTQVYLYCGGKMQKNFRVLYNSALQEELKNLLGEINVKYEKKPVRIKG
jgi:DNA polymerase-3 subunit alpha